jgi:hypothetical protein
MRKALSLWLALFLCLAGGTESCSAQLSNSWHQSTKKFSSRMAPYGWNKKMKNMTSPIERKYHDYGPFAVECLQLASNSKRIKTYSVWMPKVMVSQGSIGRLPLVIMVNGTGVKATSYASVFEHLASWGFIVAGNEDKMAGPGDTSSMTLDLMLKENEHKGSPFYQRIDTANIGITGHSQGGAGVFTAITKYANGRRYKVAVSESPAHKELANFLKSDYDISRVGIPLLITASTGMSGFLHDPDDGKGNRICDIKDMKSDMQIIHKAHPSVPVVIARLADSSKTHGDNLMESEPYLAVWFTY